MENPLVSVIIPVYNHEKYVQETIKSIINQTYKNIELLLLDDGSKDNSFAKALGLKEECEKRFVRVVMETKENEGTKATTNKLFELASGKYVYLIASDDLAKPNAIQKELEFLENNPDYVLAVGDDEVIDKDGILQNVPTAKENISRARKINFKSDDFGNYATLFFIGNHVPNGYLMKKSILDKCGELTDEAPLEDWWLMLHFAKYGKIKYIDEIMLSYRIHGENTFTKDKRMRQMARQTFKNEVKTLKTADFSTMLPVVKKTYLQYKFFGKLAKLAKKLELRLKFKNS